MARSLQDDDLALDDPPPDVWATIAERTAAPAAALPIAGIVAVGVSRGSDDTGQVIAQARLEALADVPPADAALVDRNGTETLDVPVDEADLPPVDGFYEVWLIDEAIDGMVSLGPLRADGTYQIPAEIDFRRYPIVDISRRTPRRRPHPLRHQHPPRPPHPLIVRYWRWMSLTS